MARSRSWKRVAAFVLALTMVSSSLPASFASAEVAGSGTVAAENTTSEKQEESKESEKKEEESKTEEAKLSLHSITVDDKIKHGKIEASRSKASKGQEIYVIVKPDKGYVIDKLTMNGEQVAINDQGMYKIAMPDADVVFSAVFKTQTFAVKIDENIKNGTLTADKKEAAKDEAVVLTPKAEDGYTLSKVLMNGEQVAVNDKGEYSVAMPEKDTTFSAVFVKEGEYTVTVDKDIKNGTVTADKTTAKTGEAITLTVTPDKDYVVFKVTMNGEQVAVNDEGKYVIAMMGEDITISAEFAKAGKFKVAVDEKITNGKLTADKNEAATGETIKLEATPEEGYMLEKIMMGEDQVAVNDKGEYLVVMPDKDVTFTAVFVKESDELAFQKYKDNSLEKISTLGKTDDSPFIISGIEWATNYVKALFSKDVYKYNPSLSLEDQKKVIDNTIDLYTQIVEAFRVIDKLYTFRDELVDKLEKAGKETDSENAQKVRNAGIQALLGFKFDEDTSPEDNLTSLALIYSKCVDWLDTQRANDQLEKSTRVWGNDRYETSLKAADMYKTQKKIEKFSALVIATGTDYADALSAAYLAKVKDAPIILTNTKTKEMDRTLDYIHANCDKNTQIYLIGGESAISLLMQKKLTTLAEPDQQYKVTRLQGNNRYETNLAVLNEAGVKDEQLVIASGNDYADALSASASNTPVLLVNNKLTKLSEAQEKFLKDNKTSGAVIAGGTAAVNADLEKQINETVKNVKRIGGKNRYETSAMLAEEFNEYTDLVALTYANNYPDGIVAAPLAMLFKCPIVLTATGRTAEAEEYAKNATVTKTLTFGGTKLISDEAVKKIETASKDA